MKEARENYDTIEIMLYERKVDIIDKLYETNQEIKKAWDREFEIYDEIGKLIPENLQEEYKELYGNKLNDAQGEQASLTTFCCYTQGLRDGLELAKIFNIQ